MADAGNNRVQEFDEEGEYLGQFGSAGTGNGEFDEPEGIAIDSNGDIWVADTYNARLQEFDAEGEFIQVVGEYGEEEGQILEAADVAICSGDTIWVADWGNNRITQFNQEGEFLSQIGGYGSGSGKFKAPDAIHIDSAGNIWVGDEGNQRVQAFNSVGDYLGQFGEAGSGEGEFSFEYPMGLATDSEGHLWVSDAESDRVQKWDVSTLEPPTTYEYDLAGNLTGINRVASGETEAIDEAYAYNGTGLRASQTVSEATSYLTWDTTASIPLLLDDDAASYVYGPGGLPIEQIVAGKAEFHHHDQLGSTRLLTDENGEATGTFSYGAYGSPTESTGSATTPLGFAGQYTNAQSGLQYLRARVYDPVTGQFLTRDPLEALYREPYRYAGSDPANNVDPSGLCNANPFTGSFWTEGNCISESAFNPLKYYEEEIEAIENGCSYWEAVTHGLKGASVLALDAAALFAAVEAAPAASSTLTGLVRQFALQYPREYVFLLNRAAGIGTGPPVLTTSAAFFWNWLEEHVR